MNFTLHDTLPEPAAWMSLRADAGWAVFTEAQAVEALSNTRFGVTAYDDAGHLIGMARVVGDGVICFYVQDVIVLRSWQRKGVGTAIIKRLMTEIERRAAPKAMVGLMSALGKEEFYESLGFVRRPTDKLGAGMWLRLKMEG